MLTYNLDTCDSLTNGTFGQIIGVESNDQNCVNRILVCFENEISGKQRRENFVQLQQKYFPKHATPIDRIEFHYSLSKKPTSASSNAVAIQFPIRLAFAATAHKIQGASVKKPDPLVVDLRTVMEAAQGYVMLSRVQALSQLFILEDVCAKKLYASTIAMNELEVMHSLSMNRRHVSWKLIISCNIRSLHHFKDMISIPNIFKTDVICLQETWLKGLPKDTDFLIEGFQRSFNIGGHGKGIVTFYRGGYDLSEKITRKEYQIAKVASHEYIIINIYRSSRTSSTQFIKDLYGFLEKSREMFIVGDFNICFLSEVHHPVIRFLISQGFQQLVKRPTQIEGRLIDHVYHYSPASDSDCTKFTVKQQSPYFTDHDVLSVVQVKYLYCLSV